MEPTAFYVPDWKTSVISHSLEGSLFDLARGNLSLGTLCIKPLVKISGKKILIEFLQFPFKMNVPATVVSVGLLQCTRYCPTTT